MWFRLELIYSSTLSSIQPFINFKEISGPLVSDRLVHREVKSRFHWIWKLEGCTVSGNTEEAHLQEVILMLSPEG